jgi:hypothetical protein
MYQKIKNILIILFFFTFTIFVTKYYFSEENKIFTNRSRTSYSITLDADNDKLQLLENDTKDIIFYIDDIEKFKKERKKRFWEKLISSKK